MSKRLILLLSLLFTSSPAWALYPCLPYPGNYVTCIPSAGLKLTGSQVINFANGSIQSTAASAPTGTAYSTAVFNGSGALTGSFTQTDPTGTSSLLTDQRLFIDSGGNSVGNWDVTGGGGFFSDAPAGFESFDWNLRQFFSAVGNPVLEYGSGAIRPIPITTVQRDALTVQIGALVNNDDTNTLQRWNGSSWISIPGAVTGTANAVAQFNGSGALISSPDMFDTGGFVGIGTSSPAVKLEVVDSGTDQNLVASMANMSSHTTVDGSNTVIGLEGVANEIVDSGATNDKAVFGGSFNAQRANGSDDGTLHELSGVSAIAQNQSGAAGVTEKQMGVDAINMVFSGNVTNMYDFHGQSVPAGGTVTNHYGFFEQNSGTVAASDWGVYIEPATQNFMAGKLKIGSGGDTSTYDLEVNGTASMTGFVMNTTPTNGYVLTTNGSGVATWQPTGAPASPLQSTAFNFPTDGATTSVDFQNEILYRHLDSSLGWMTVPAYDWTQGLVYSFFTNDDPVAENRLSMDVQNGKLYKLDGTTVALNWKDGTDGDINLVDHSMNGSWAILGDHLTVNNTAGSQISGVWLYSSVAGNPYTAVQSSPSLLTAWNMTLPIDGGASGQVLTTDGTGVTTWASPTASRSRESNAVATSATCTVTCSGSKNALGGGCQNSLGLNLTNSYPSADNVWSCAYTLATGTCTAWAICSN